MARSLCNAYGAAAPYPAVTRTVAWDAGARTLRATSATTASRPTGTLRDASSVAPRATTRAVRPANRALAMTEALSLQQEHVQSSPSAPAGGKRGPTIASRLRLSQGLKLSWQAGDRQTSARRASWASCRATPSPRTATSPPRRAATARWTFTATTRELPPSPAAASLRDFVPGFSADLEEVL